MPLGKTRQLSDGEILLPSQVKRVGNTTLWKNDLDETTKDVILFTLSLCKKISHIEESWEFKRGDYKCAVISGIEAVSQHLMMHFPASGSRQSKLPNNPLIV